MIREVFEKVKKYRESKGWSTHRLADKANMHQPTLLRSEKNQIAAINRLDGYIEKIAPAFEMTPEDFIPDGLEHLPRQLRTFVKNPKNMRWIKKAYLECALVETSKELQ